jgi:uroporphyrinogen-III decarboxylase
MTSTFFLDLAAKGARFPIGADLTLREHEDSEQILLSGERLGGVMIQAAQRFGCPLALPLMDLTVEKADLLATFLNVDTAVCDTHHLDMAPSDEVIDEVTLSKPLSPRLQANVDAIKWVRSEGSLPPCGMAIGPFSLMTKLVASPIEPVYMAGMGMSGEDDEEVALVEGALALAEREIMRSLEAQVEAGAQTVFIAEPAANLAYFSPNQMEAGSDFFERLAIEPNRRIIDWLKGQGVQVIFHCCGELIDPMVESFCDLQPHMLSLGSSRDLARDSRLAPKDIVLYGNLPSKRFYSDDLCSLESVIEMAQKLASDMAQAGHPFILGSECDVLSVPGAEATIKAKVQAMLTA